jgi:chromate transporter
MAACRKSHLLLYGIKPVVLAIILNALWRLGKKAVKTRKLLVNAVGVVALLLLLKLDEAIALLIGGLLGMVWLRTTDGDKLPGDQANLLIASLTTGATLKATGAVGASVGYCTQPQRFLYGSWVGFS